MESDRKFRFKHWQHFVESGGRIAELGYLNIFTVEFRKITKLYSAFAQGRIN
ncbi:hypothetical protein JOC26_001742 [Sporohalobacter salinus]|nr:hypothetical protein [Sporohalobacter salinus]